MEAHFIDILCKRFPSLSRIEICQSVLLAELKADCPRLVYTVALRDMLMQLRKDRPWASRIADIEQLLHEEDRRDTDRRRSADVDPLAAPDTIFEAWMLDEEWHAIIVGLPPLARKLAEIAKRCAEAFEDLPGGVWSRDNLIELRRRVKRDFVFWERRHSENKYFIARATLVKALRRARSTRR